MRPRLQGTLKYLGVCRDGQTIKFRVQGLGFRGKWLSVSHSLYAWAPFAVTYGKDYGSTESILRRACLMQSLNRTVHLSSDF